MPTAPDLRLLAQIPDLLPTFLEISSEVIWTYDFIKQEYHWLASSENQIKYGIPDKDNGQFWSGNIIRTPDQCPQSDYQQAVNDTSITDFCHIYQFRAKKGSTFIVEDKMRFIRDVSGEPKLVVGVWRDITSDKEKEESYKTALKLQQTLNEELELRQEKIRLTQEELKQTNEQLTTNNLQLIEREFILNISQKLARIGSWEYEYASKSFFWSEEMYNVYGVDKTTSPNDVEFLSSLFEPASWQVISSLYQGILVGTRKSFDVTVQVITPIGYRKWLRMAGYCPEHKPADRMIGIVYDITYFKEAEARLRSSEEKFSKAFNGNPEPVLIVRRSDLVVIEVNNKVKPLLGFSGAELVGRNLFDVGLFSHEDATFAMSSKVSEDVPFECALRTKQGLNLVALLSRNTIYIEGVANYIMVVRDITARKVAEERLRLSEANLKATMNNTSVMVWSVDRNLRYVMMNVPFLQYIRETYGYDIEEGMYIIPETNDPTALASRSKWEQFYKRALSGETFSATEERFGKQFSYSMNPIIENGKVMGVSVFAEDISDRLRNERELVHARETLAEYKLIALRSVMNPHFIFNALNSIQYFITRNDRLNAINYLSTFSKLIRGILTNSKNRTVRLSEEIELLRHYVHLEMLRFENKFEFVLEVDPDIDVENIEVQSLIVQPFVENAILHGLYNSEQPGCLKLSVKNDLSGGIVFIVEDNGIGREAARKLRAKLTPGHQSVGISLTEERLRLINSNKDVSIHIEDLYTENKPAGTKVEIWVKL